MVSLLLRDRDSTDLLSAELSGQQASVLLRLFVHSACCVADAAGEADVSNSGSGSGAAGALPVPVAAAAAAGLKRRKGAPGKSSSSNDREKSLAAFAVLTDCLTTSLARLFRSIQY